jgi:hypothetical protein
MFIFKQMRFLGYYWVVLIPPYSVADSLHFYVESEDVTDWLTVFWSYTLCIRFILAILSAQLCSAQNVH